MPLAYPLGPCIKRVRSPSRCLGLHNTHSPSSLTVGRLAHRYNSDFALEWPRPLPPNVQLVGALLPRPARPLPPHFQVRLFSRAIPESVYRGKPALADILGRE